LKSAQFGAEFTGLLSRNDKSGAGPVTFCANGFPGERARPANQQSGAVQERKAVCPNNGSATEVSALIKRIVQLERDQKADEGRIDTVLKKAHTEIADLKRRHLDPAALRNALATIRDNTAVLTQDVRKNMHKRIMAARKLQEVLGPDFLAQHTRFASEDVTDATLRTRFFKLLQGTSTSALLNYLKDAIETGNFACAESIRFEFICRADRHLYSAEYEAIRGIQRDDDPAETQIRLITIADAATKVDRRLMELLQGGPS